MTIYKQFNVNLLFDAAVGGKMWNGTKGALAFFGKAGYTTEETTLSDAQANSLVTYYGQTVAEVYPHAQNSNGTYTVRGTIDDFGGGQVFLDELCTLMVLVQVLLVQMSNLLKMFHGTD